MIEKPVLKITDLHAYIGQFYILQGINLEVRKSEIMVLLGRNGAGKTTTLRCVMGLVAARSGEIGLEGESIANLAPYNVANKKVAFVPEDQGIFSLLTVEENIRVAISSKSTKAELQQRLDSINHSFPALKDAWRKKAGNLSGGQKQMLAIARSLVNDNKLIMLDEPSKGLAPVMVKELASVISNLKAHSTILLVEQNFPFASQLGDSFSIISDGKTVLYGGMRELLNDTGKQQLYLGVHTGGAN